MKKTAFTIALALLAFGIRAAENVPNDTIIRYNNRKIVINDNNNETSVTIYQLDEYGDTIHNQKIYEGVFTDGKSVERVYKNSFEISVPDIFKPKSKRRPSRSHWAGFGIGFSDLPDGADFNGELADILNSSRSLQYNLNPVEASWRLGNSNLTAIVGMGIQFNSLYWQKNKAIEVIDYQSVITTTEPGKEYRKSRLHYTCLTFPLLFETNWTLGGSSHFFVNGGVIGKIKTSSSSKAWWTDENGRNQKTQFPGELNIRPVTLDLVFQAGVNDFGFFLTYAPFKLFRGDKGPDANQAVAGLQFYF